jgi:hypothetical protein
MELALNLVWLTLVVCLTALWLRHGPPPQASRRAQLVALALIAIIFLPAISMTDDLLAAQNPAEIDTTAALRRNHDFLGASLHASAMLAAPPPRFELAWPCSLCARTPRQDVLRTICHSELTGIENRPPPRA